MSYPAPPPASPPPSASSATAPPTAGGFFNDLFDIRFTRFVSLRLISIVYVLILAAASIVALIAIFGGFTNGPAAGIVTLIVTVLIWLIVIVTARVSLEAYAVLFRIHDDTNRTADAVAGSRGTPAGYDPGPPGTGMPRTYPSQQGFGAPPPAPPGNAPGDPSGPPWS
jgi:hypothetical protein